jgi:hypothetical protein
MTWRRVAEPAGFRVRRPWYACSVERRDLYEDDLTEERQPSPEQREDVAETEELDPDESSDDDDDDTEGSPD